MDGPIRDKERAIDTQAPGPGHLATPAQLGAKRGRLPPVSVAGPAMLARGPSARICPGMPCDVLMRDRS